MVRTGSFGLSSREPCQNKHKNDLLLVACELWVGGFFQSLASCRLAVVLALPVFSWLGFFPSWLFCCLGFMSMFFEQG